jgi:hypothetical protein
MQDGATNLSPALLFYTSLCIESGMDRNPLARLLNLVYTGANLSCLWSFTLMCYVLSLHGLTVRPFPFLMSAAVWKKESGDRRSAEVYQLGPTKGRVRLATPSADHDKGGEKLMMAKRALPHLGISKRSFDAVCQ